MTEYSANDYILYRLQKAKETIAEVEVHLTNEFWNTAVNRMYYAAFYAVNALLTISNTETSSHSGVRQQFGLLYVKTGIIEKHLAKHYTDLFEKRQKSDYNDFFDFDKATAEKLFPLTLEFILEIEKIINKKLNNPY